MGYSSRFPLDGLLGPGARGARSRSGIGEERPKGRVSGSTTSTRVIGFSLGFMLVFGCCSGIEILQRSLNLKGFLGGSGRSALVSRYSAGVLCE